MFNRNMHVRLILFYPATTIYFSPKKTLYSINEVVYKQVSGYKERISFIVTSQSCKQKELRCIIEKIVGALATGFALE